MRAKSGGGITSNKLVQSKAPKIEPRSKAVSPASADLIGQTVGFKKPPLERAADISRQWAPPRIWVRDRALIAQSCPAVRKINGDRQPQAKAGCKGPLIEDPEQSWREG